MHMANVVNWGKTTAAGVRLSFPNVLFLFIIIMHLKFYGFTETKAKREKMNHLVKSTHESILLKVNVQTLIAMQ